MISGLSSSVATAIRTAGEARQRMDVAARQIATGQRVASAKDDGAAYARTRELEGQKAQAQVRRDVLVSGYRQVVDVQAQMDVAFRGILDRMGNIIRQAMAHAPGSAARQQLAADWAQELANTDTIRGATGLIDSGMGVQVNGRWGIRTTSADALVANRTIWTMLATSPEDGAWHTIDPASNGMPYGMINIATFTQAQLETALTTVTTFRDVNNQLQVQTTARNQNWLDEVAAETDREIDRLEQAVGSLTQADLGKASTALRQNETRQQLALQTIRNSLEAYGSYASGLLSSVQQTQRALA